MLLKINISIFPKNFDSRHHIGAKEFKKNKLSTKRRKRKTKRRLKRFSILECDFTILCR